MRIKAWHPQNRLYYPDGLPFKEKQQYESLDQLFTKRNLTALAWLMEAIEKEPHHDMKDFLKISFTSTVHLCSRLLAEGAPGYRPFSGVGWNQQSYWFTPRYLETNVWRQFETAVIGHQSLSKAKEESNRFFPEIEFGRSVEDVLAGHADVYIHCGDALDFMKNMTERYGPCVDYIFTDPPYDASVQYGELAYLWVAWLKKNEGYTGQLIAKEIIRNERQHKPFEVYQSLLSNAFRRMHDVLKANAYLTLTFHNPTFKVRNATIYGGVMAGLNLEKIHHQELARPSAKSLLQPFGSAQGDFYLRFHKPPTPSAAIRPEQIDAARFERIVMETAKRIMAERGEPTPYTNLINAIDPELARNGYFSELTSGLDVKTILERHREKEFTLVSMRIGGAEGKAWWFRDPSSIPHLKTIPLSERVEQTVLRKLQERGRVTFTDMWKTISEEFPNALTTDSTSIREALQMFARQVGKDEWMLKTEYNKNQIQRMHTRMLAILAGIGKTQGYDIWIGRREQGDSLAEGFPGRDGELRQYISRPSLKELKNASNIKEVENIDALWLRGNTVEAAFEVEATTSMTESLKRGSNIDPSVRKYLVIPQEREEQLRRKLRSPLFGERFQMDSWNIIFFEALERSFHKHRGKVDIVSLIEKRVAKSLSKNPHQGAQLDIFSSASAKQDEPEG